MPLQAQTTSPTPPPLPALDLGQTNIFDGEGKPGNLLEIIGNGTIDNRLSQNNGDSAPGRNHQRTAALVIHPVFVSHALVAGAHPGVELLLPVSYVHNDFAASGSGRHTGLGDITVAPFLQWSSTHPAAGDLSLRLALQIVAPSGDYDPSRAVNTGGGSWQISPYLAATWRTSDRWEISGRMIDDHSGWASSRTQQGVPVHVRAGHVVVLNLSTSYAVNPSLRAGIGGYALRQLSDARLSGEPFAPSRQRVVGIGPIARWHASGYSVLAAAYDEFGARNRPSGVTLNVRLQHPF